MPRMILACLAALLVMLSIDPALAQNTSTTTTTTVDLNLKPWIDLAFDFVKIVAMALAGGIAAYIGRKFGQHWDAQTQATLRDGISKLLQAGIQRAQASVSTENMEDVKIQDGIMSKALKYAVDNGPALLKKAGVDVTTPEGQRQLAEKLESLMAPAIMVAASSKDQVSVATAATIANPAVTTPPVVIPVPVPVADGVAPALTPVAAATANAAPPKSNGDTP